MGVPAVYSLADDDSAVRPSPSPRRPRRSSRPVVRLGPRCRAAPEELLALAFGLDAGAPLPGVLIGVSLLRDVLRATADFGRRVARARRCGSQPSRVELLRHAPAHGAVVSRSPVERRSRSSRLSALVREVCVSSLDTKSGDGTANVYRGNLAGRRCDGELYARSALAPRPWSRCTHPSRTYPVGEDRIPPTGEAGRLLDIALLDH